MPISESDISVLIPTYKYRDKVARAVDSALASGAGEIIVADDCSRDGTMELLASYNDPRLRAIENPINIGLWENHLAALEHATKPWIKFIQADDYLLPGGLTVYAAAADPGVSVVWSNPLVIDEATGATRHNHRVTKIWRLSGEDYLDLAIRSCWILGSPSQMMLRADAVVRDPAAWITEISADLVFGAVAASRGDVVLLPAGGVAHVEHARQDSNTQGARRGLRRLVGTVEYLLDQPEPALRRFGTFWAAQNRRVAWRTAMSGVLRQKVGPMEALQLVLRNEVHARGCFRDAQDRQVLIEGRLFRRYDRQPHDIDTILTRAGFTSDDGAVRREDEK
ncbi:glycosyl transferase family 2 [Roseinatronobacter thiooxidans]|uniref:Glycosyl transferase family 2 n=1 Tax=Roseinatronobacter thiooxidans TaxID=121821 RepID=A0A2W7QIK7_9RHOB|nr:glycosyltransferase family 2 protein [Roseinatronobacter thiooxidans]PZX45760.1 glycosyl transferase family 2 [Roseinatronobacter thiooxidans]